MDLEEAAALMVQHRIRRLPVMDGEQLVGHRHPRRHGGALGRPPARPADDGRGGQGGAARVLLPPAGRLMAPLNAAQRRTRNRVEAVIRLMAPAPQPRAGGRASGSHASSSPRTTSTIRRAGPGGAAAARTRERRPPHHRGLRTMTVTPEERNDQMAPERRRPAGVGAQAGAAVGVAAALGGDLHGGRASSCSCRSCATGRRTRRTRCATSTSTPPVTSRAGSSRRSRCC